MGSMALDITGLTKRYRDFTLDNVAFSVPYGVVVGFIGENGAGKSTLLKCIMNLIHIDGGNIKVFDNTAGMGKHELNRTGSLIEYPNF